jgi:hypothetical protein
MIVNSEDLWALYNAVTLDIKSILIVAVGLFAVVLSISFAVKAFRALDFASGTMVSGGNFVDDNLSFSLISENNVNNIENDIIYLGGGYTVTNSRIRHIEEHNAPAETKPFHGVFLLNYMTLLKDFIANIDSLTPVYESKKRTIYCFYCHGVGEEGGYEMSVPPKKLNYLAIIANKNDKAIITMFPTDESYIRVLRSEK